MKTQPLISVIVPCYNQGKYIIECLNSVKAQTYANWECIIIDDGSGDDTKAVVQEQIKNESRFVYQYQANAGVSAARNNAIKTSKGKYILPLDGDDKIGNTYLEKAIALFEKDQNLSLVYCEAELFGNRSGKWFLPDFSFELLLKQNLFFCSALFKRYDFDRIEGYDTAMRVGLEDWEFWISLLSENAKVAKINDTLFYYRIVSNSRNSSFNSDHEREIRRYIYNKHKTVYDKHFNISDLIYDNYLVTLESNGIKTSRDYRMGKKILSPLRLLKNIISKNK